MSDRIKVFFCEDTGFLLAYRRFKCADRHETEIDDGRIAKADWKDGAGWDEAITCHCGKMAKVCGRDASTVYRRVDTDEEVGGKRSLPAGAVYEWRGSQKGPDGRALICICPDGHPWIIDGRASNCTSPCATCGVIYKDHDHAKCGYVDSRPSHRCWVRHGRPEDGTLHVDKNGDTCSAGSGSIATGKWHGFLHHGELHT